MLEVSSAPYTDALLQREAVLPAEIVTHREGADRRLLDRIENLERHNRELEVRNQQLELNVRHLVSLVYVDALTGLYNRRYFNAALDAEIERATQSGKPFALLLCDIDFFKHHNDTYGHAHGDEVLLRIAVLMKQACRRPRDFAARYGGEEFALLLPHMNAREAVQFADRLRTGVKSLAIPHTASDMAAQVTISIGVTICGGGFSSRTRRHLVRAADHALYRAKNAGRDRTKFEAQRHPVA